MLTRKTLARVILFLAPFSLLIIMGNAAAQTLALASHRAVYDLSLAEVKQGGGVESVRGRIIMDIDNTCEGYIVNQRMLMELVIEGGKNILSDFHLSTWEDLSGNTMRFTASNRVNGTLVDQSDGIATMDSSDGEVIFKDEDKEPLFLPKGVMFPTAHTAAIVKAARNGQNLIAAKVYDGSGPEGLLDSLTVIGKQGGASSEVLSQSEMKDMTSWPVQLSYFDLKKHENEPDYMVSLRMHENGVGTDLLLQYKDFSLSGKLVNLKLKKSVKCN